jgi:hypothetical protein
VRPVDSRRIALYSRLNQINSVFDIVQHFGKFN